MIRLRWYGYINGSGFLVSLYNSMDHTFSILYFTPDTFTNRRENPLIPPFFKRTALGISGLVRGPFFWAERVLFSIFPSIISFV